MLNSVTLIGRMGTDLREKVVRGGKRLVTFSLATTEFVPGAGDHTEWHQAVAWEQFCDEAEKATRCTSRGPSEQTLGSAKTERRTTEPRFKYQNSNYWRENDEYI